MAKQTKAPAKGAPLKVISLFTGLGGMDYGLEAAGFETRVAVEMNKHAVEALRANRKWPVLKGDVNKVPIDLLLRKARLKPREADVLIGGPPCQPFSAAGQGTGRKMQMDDPRAATLMGYMRVVRHTLPKVCVMENVPQLGTPGKDVGLRIVLREFERINADCKTKYRPVLAIVKAAYYGVPQIRSRLIIVAARDGRAFRFPDPTHVPKDEVHAYGKGIKPFTTAWDAIGDLKEPKEPRKITGQYAGLLESIPEGENWSWFNGEGGRPRLFTKAKFSYTLRKLAKAEPSWTVVASMFTTNGPFHWNSRALTFREMCRIQTIPDDVRVKAPYAEEKRMAGNAVPSLMAEVIGRAIREQLLDSPIKGPLKLLPPNRGKPPAPTPPRPLSKRFRAQAESGASGDGVKVRGRRDDAPAGVPKNGRTGSNRVGASGDKRHARNQVPAQDDRAVRRAAKR